MHLYYFLAVVISLSCGSLPPTEVDPSVAALATAGMVTAWIILSHVAARTVGLYVRDGKLEPLAGADWLEKQLAAFRWLGLAVSVFCLAGFGLARSLDQIPWVADSMSLQAIILLSPVLAITVGTWSAEHRYGVLLGYTSGSVANHASSVWQAFRAGLAWLVVPVLMLLAMADGIEALPVSSSASSWITIGMIALFVPLGLPWLIRHLFKTQTLGQRDAQWVGQLMNESGIRRTGVVRWDTGGSTFNAMVAGFVPPLRTLLLSDRLLDELPRDQIAMVVLHEAAHLRRRHVPMRMLAILPAWGAGALISRSAGDHSWAMVAGSVVGILLTMVILRWVAYRTEFDADVQACHLATRMKGKVDHVPTSFEAATESLAAALMRVTFDQPAGRKATWLHPSVADRVAWMRRQNETPVIKLLRSDRIPVQP